VSPSSRHRCEHLVGEDTCMIVAPLVWLRSELGTRELAPGIKLSNDEADTEWDDIRSATKYPRFASEGPPAVTHSLYIEYPWYCLTHEMALRAKSEVSGSGDSRDAGDLFFSWLYELDILGRNHAAFAAAWALLHSSVACLRLVRPSASQVLAISLWRTWRHYGETCEEPFEPPCDSVFEKYLAETDVWQCLLTPDLTGAPGGQATLDERWFGEWQRLLSAARNHPADEWSNIASRWNLLHSNYDSPVQMCFQAVMLLERLHPVRRTRDLTSSLSKWAEELVPHLDREHIYRGIGSITRIRRALAHGESPTVFEIPAMEYRSFALELVRAAIRSYLEA